MNCPPLAPILCFPILFLVQLASSTDCRAQDEPVPPALTSSLQFVPADAAFYYVSMNHKAQLNALIESRAWKQLMETRVVKQMRKSWRSGRRRGWEQFGRDNPFARLQQTWSETGGSPAGRMLTFAVKQILANEVFVYADSNYTVVSEAARRFGTRIATLTELNEKERFRKILNVASEEFEGLVMPTLFVGAVLDEPEGIKSLLATMDIALSGLFDNLADAGDPFLANAYEVLDEPGLYAVTLTLNSDDFPWETLESDPELSDHLPDLKRLFHKRSLSIAIAVKDRLLVAMIAPDLESLNKLGQGSLLIDDPRFVEIKKCLEGQRLARVLYESEPLAKCRRRSWIEMIDSTTSVLSTLLRQGPEGSDGKLDALFDELVGDASELGKDLDLAIPEAGASLSWSWLTEYGLAGKACSWSGTRYAGEPAPLKLIRKAGPSPLLLFTGRDRERTAQFAVARKWMDKSIDYLVEYVPKYLPEADKATLGAFIEGAESPIRSAIAATSDLLVPAMDSGEYLVVFDLVKSGEHWHRELPESGKPGPVPIVSLVVEISDADKVRETGRAFLESATEIVGVLQGLPQTEIPDSFRIASPQKESVNGFERRFWPLPQEWGLDSDLQPNLMLGEGLLGFSLSRSRLESILGKNAEELATPVSGIAEQPLVAACVYNHSQLVDGIRTWVIYALSLDQSLAGSLELSTRGENDELHFQESDLHELLDAGFDLIGCFQSYSSTTRVVDGVWITESETRFSDIDAEE